MFAGRKPCSRAFASIRSVGTVVLVVSCAAALVGCQDSAKRPSSQEILTRTIAGLESQPTPNSIELVKSRTVVSGSESTTTITAETWRDAARALERAETRSKVETPGGSGVELRTIHKNHGIRVVVEKGKSRLAPVIDPADVQIRHQLYSSIHSSCGSCHNESMHGIAQTATSETVLAVQARQADEQQLVARALARGARVSDSTRSVEGTDTYVITRRATEEAGTLRVFARTSDFAVVRWDARNPQGTVSWTLKSSEQRPEGDLSVPEFKSPDGISPQSPTAVLARTITELRTQPKPGTVLTRFTKWTRSNPEAQTGTVVEDQEWLAADGKRGMTVRETQETNPSIMRPVKKTSFVYRDGKRVAEAIKKNGELHASKDPDRASKELRHVLLGLQSRKCQDCHSTHYKNGNYELVNTTFVQRAKNASQNELIALALEESDVDVRPYDATHYTLTLRNPPPDMGFSATVRAKDFVVTQWNLYEGEFTQQWELMSQESDAEKDVPASFVTWPTWLKSLPVLTAE